jgi:hypothetical protein
MYTLHRNSEHTARHDSAPMRSGLHVRRQSLNGSAACVVRQELCTGSLSRICTVLYVTYGAFTWEGVPTFSARGALGLPIEPGAYALSFECSEDPHSRLCTAALQNPNRAGFGLSTVRWYSTGYRPCVLTFL